MEDRLLHLEFQTDETPNNLKEVLKSTLFGHQKTLLSWARNREQNILKGCSGGFILDEPGLGKTLSLLSLVVTRRLTLPTLVICPSHLIQHWIDEINLHFKENSIKYATYFGTRRHLIAIDPNVDIILTSYGTVRNDFANDIKDAHKHRFPEIPFLFPCFRKDSILNNYFGRLILDESHNIRSKIITADACLNINSHHIWCITATPVMNRIDDLQNQVALLGIHPYDSEITWNNNISLQVSVRPITVFNILMNEIMVPFSIRRIKTNLQFVDRHEEDIWIKFGEEEENLYQYLLDYTRERAFKLLENIRLLKAKNMKHFLKKMRFCITVFILRLRQACCHPEILLRKIIESHKNVESFDDAIKLLKQKVSEGGLEEECCICLSNTATYSNKKCSHCICKNCSSDILKHNIFNCPLCRIPCRIWVPVEESLEAMEEETEISKLLKEPQTFNLDPLLSTKIRWLHSHLKTHNDKVVVISQWTEFLSIIARHFNSENITYTYLNGSIPANLRHNFVKEFQENTKIQVCLLSLCASSEGINLTSACRVYHMDPWWNTARATQASDRVHRLGQTKNVSIQHLFISNTIEESIFDMQNKKANMTHVLYGKKDATEEMTWANSVGLMLNQREKRAYKHLRKTYTTTDDEYNDV